MKKSTIVMILPKFINELTDFYITYNKLGGKDFTPLGIESADGATVLLKDAALRKLKPGNFIIIWPV